MTTLFLNAMWEKLGGAQKGRETERGTEWNQSHLEIFF